MSKKLQGYWTFDWNKWGVGVTLTRCPSDSCLWAGTYLELLVGPLGIGLAWLIVK